MESGNSPLSNMLFVNGHWCITSKAIVDVFFTREMSASNFLTYFLLLIWNALEIEDNINHRIQERSGWNKGWPLDLYVTVRLTTKKYCLSLRENFNTQAYGSMTMMVYGTKWWVVKGQQQSKNNVAEIRQD